MAVCLFVPPLFCEELYLLGALHTLVCITYPSIPEAYGVSAPEDTYLYLCT